MPELAIVFGAAGALGSEIAVVLREFGVTVLPATHKESAEDGWLATGRAGWAESIGADSVDRVVWAQGANATGGILSGGAADVRPLFEANVVYVVDTLAALLDRQALRVGARLVIVSSIWQQTARREKLGYATSKAAVAGLTRSLAADLSGMRCRVNAVLPGVVDSPMTRANLEPAQIERLRQHTPSGALVSPADVAQACAWLTDPRSAGVNAQSLIVDGGWSDVRDV